MSFARPIVIDTGVLISAALRPESVPALALEKALLRFDPCVSSATLAELETVLMRLMRAKFDAHASPETRRAFIDAYRQRSDRFEVTRIVTDCIDPKDNMFLALAETAEAELIVASDPHLTNMHPWRGIPIITPSAFLVAIP